MLFVLLLTKPAQLWLPDLPHSLHSDFWRDFLCYCSAEWEESEGGFVQSATGAFLYLLCIRSHLPHPSVLLCSPSMCSWIQPCIALVSMLAMVRFLAQLKEILLLCREKRSHCSMHIVCSRLSKSIFWSCHALGLFVCVDLR